MSLAASNRFNLSHWAIRNPALTSFLLIATLIVGLLSFPQLGRLEDPVFNVPTMTVVVAWPGASPQQVQDQVLNRIEQALQELPAVDYVRSFARPGYGGITLWMEGGTKKPELDRAWYLARKKVGDLRGQLPEGVRGPFFNDEFTDVYAALYALQAPGLPTGDLHRLAAELKKRLQAVPGANKVDLLGRQSEQVFIEFDSQTLAAQGLNPGQLAQALAGHTALQPSGHFEGAHERHAVRVNTEFTRLEELAELPLQIGGRLLRLKDLAQLRWATSDPASFTVRRNGSPALALGVTLVPGGDVLALGRALEAKQAELQALLPAGVSLERYADQPAVADAAVWEFERAFLEALLIVLAVCFVSLGWRTGIVVAASVPLVLALVAAAMHLLGWPLDRISLGALIIALGLLVDDAIIAVEMMVVKIEEGWDRVQAASHAYTVTAFPMLSGTLITIAGFMPVGLAKSISGEYAGGIFWVVGLALIASWLVAVVFTPYLGVWLLPKKVTVHAHYGGRGYERLRGWLRWSLDHRWQVLGATGLALALSAAGMVLFVQQQFFPTASRPELLIDLRLREGASLAATERQVAQLETWLAQQPEQRGFTAYTGAGSPRFYLSLSPELPNPGYAQFVVQTPGIAEREQLRARLRALFDANEFLPDAHARVTRLEFGPPVGYPVQFRILGPDPAELRRLALQVREQVRQSELVRDVQLDWFEPVRRLQVQVNRAEAARAGVSPSDVQQAVQLALSGAPVAQLRVGEELIDVVLRGSERERLRPEQLGQLQLFARNGAVLPLSSVATVQEGIEEPVLWRRNREAFITVRADVRDGVQGPYASQRIAPKVAQVALPPGYRIELGGAIEESNKSNVALFKVFPAMFGVILLLLMLQLRSWKRVGLVFATAPLGLIGAVPALLAFRAPFGFVALLGLIALGGMIQRNAVILVDQIDQDLAGGAPLREAIIEATVRRARPVLLTAAAAVLAMIPLTRSVFWGPMAITIMGGLVVATVLTLVVVPVGYALMVHGRREAA
ncbi:MAG: efflux RND transporter permease subunit [Burkholderiales bacterium]|uniref:efflux RND transporter permease subunit n=1 Tax=Inhella sp. TaxID=1921806 RepID=UPI001ACA8A8F|nr:efflux RND transporter permease subunit [Burkholderiales bacterium]